MSNYSPIVAYGPKDSLPTTDPNKVIHGTQMDGELNAISTAITTKYDDNSTIFNGNKQINGNLSATGSVAAGGGVWPGVAFIGSQLSGRNGAGVLDLICMSAATDAKAVSVYTDSGGTLHFFFNNDTNTSGLDALVVTRSGAVPASIQGHGPVNGGLVDMTPDSGSWTTTLSGPFGSNPTNLMHWSRIGGRVNVWTDSTATAATTSAAGITLSAWPAAITPTQNRAITTGKASLGGSTSGLLTEVTVLTSGTATIFLYAATGSRMAAGTAGQSVFDTGSFAGILAGWSISYNL